MIFKTVESEKEIKEYFAIRRAVFVGEQRIFTESDVDEHDTNAIHIVATDPETGHVLGGVRCYPDGDGTWVGGRLAVSREHRNGRVARGLVLKAVSVMRERQCPHFLAYVQAQNVPFFKRLGWRPLGTLEVYHGVLHQVMEIDLGLAKESA